MLPLELERVLNKLDSIDAKLDRFQERVAVLEERNSAAKAEATDRRIAALEQFKSKAGVYLAIAAFAGATVVGAALKLLHLG